MGYVGIGIIALFIICTFVNIWMLCVMLFMCFDASWLKNYQKNILTRDKDNVRLKILKGGKEE